MRHIFTLTVVMFALLTGAFYYVFYTPALVQKEAPQFIEQYFKDVAVDSLEIGGQSFVYSGELKLYDIKAQVEWHDQVYQVEIAQLDFLNLPVFLKEQRQAVIELAGLNVRQKNFEITKAVLGVTATFNDKVFESCEIVFRDGELQVVPYRLVNTQARLQVSKTSFKVLELNAKAYGGQVKGKIEVIFAPRPSEMASLEFSDFKSQELIALNKTIFSQLSGEFTGTLRITRVEGLLQVFAIMAEMPTGGTMAPALGNRLLGYMTDEDARDKVMIALEKNKQLIFDNAQFRILSANQDLAGVTVTLANKKENLRIQETINVDVVRILKKFAWKN